MTLTTKLILLFTAGVLLLACAVLSLWRALVLRRRLQSAKEERTRLKALRRKDKPTLPGTKTPASLRYFVIAALLCGIASSAALGYGSYLTYLYAAPPSDYVDTDLWIEEDGYQDEQFTVAGVVYKALPLDCNEPVCKESMTAIFSYETPGFLNGYLTGNYYAIENRHGFDLVWNGIDLLFAPVDQAEDIVSFYRADPEAWYLLDYEQIDTEGDPAKLALNEEAITAIRAYLELDISKLETTTAIAEEGYDTVEIWAASRDGIVLINHWFTVIDGKSYIHLSSATTEQDQEKMTLAILPEAISAPLASLVPEVTE